MSSLLQFIGDALDKVDDEAANTITNLRNNNNNNKSVKVIENEKLNNNNNNNNNHHHVNVEVNNNNNNEINNNNNENSDNIPLPIKEINTLNTNNEYEREIEGLRAVWNETRERNDKLKKIIKDQENKFKIKYNEQKEQYEERINQIKLEHNNQMNELKSLISENQSDFDKALKAKEVYRSTQSRQLQQYKEIVEENQKEVNRLKLKINELENERVSIRAEQSEAATKASDMIKRIQHDALEREKRLEEENKMRENSLLAVKNREASLEAGTVEYMNALAANQRIVEEKSREIQKLLSQQRWLEADKQALEDQLQAATAQVDTLNKQINDWKNRDETENNHLRLEVKEIKLKYQQCTQDLMTAQEELANLESKIASEESSKATHLRLRELESRVRTMADHVMQKQSMIDNLKAERSALRLKLNNEQKHIALLEHDVASLQKKLAAADLSDSDNEIESNNNQTGLRARNITIDIDDQMNLEHRKKRNRRRPFATTPGIAGAVNLFDRFGGIMGTSLRRYPACRVFFALYAVVLHLWVAFILYHLLSFHD